MKDLAGKTVLITGGASGIGFHTAKRFAQAGSQVVITDIDEEALATAAQKLENQSKEVATFVVDVSKRSQVTAMAKSVVSRFGAVHVLINNAGVGYSGQLADTDWKTWQRLMNINFWGPLHHIYAFLPGMKANREGHIVNVSSGQAFFRLPTWGAYSVSKVALSAFSDTLHFELKKYNITVTTVYPFMVNTGFYKDTSTETRASKFVMGLLPYYSHSPETVGRLIFKSVRKGKRAERVSVINTFGQLARAVPPVTSLISRVSDRILANRTVTTP